MNDFIINNDLKKYIAKELHINDEYVEKCYLHRHY